MKSFCFFIFSFSLLSCSCKFFEYLTYDVDQESAEYPELVIKWISNSAAVISIYVVHYLLNDLVLLLLNFVIDLKLFLVVRRNLAAKKENLMNKSEKNDRSLPTKLKEIKNSMTNSNKLVIYSFLVYIFCRLPELVAYMHVLFLRSDSKHVFSYWDFCGDSLCALVVNVIHYLYMISYITNSVFYYKFNQKYRQAFHRLFCSNNDVKGNVIKKDQTL